MKDRSWALAWLAAPFAVTLAVFAARRLPPVEAVEVKTLDARFRALARPRRADPRLVLVTIDQASLDFFERDAVTWPWPRALYAPLVEFCKAGGAKAVVLDLLLSSPSSYGVADDQELARALEGAGNVILAMDMGRAASAPRAVPPPERLALEARADPGEAAQPKQAVRLPVRPLLAAAAAVGDVAQEPDADGVFRRVSLLSRMGGRYYPTLPAAVAAVVSGEREVDAPAGSLRLAGRDVPLSEGRMLVRYHGAALAPRLAPGRKTYASYSIGDVIQSWNAVLEKRAPLLPPSTFKDKIVLVAATAPGLLDNHPSPISPVFPGTEVVAAAADNLLNGDFLRRGPAWTALLLIALGVWGGLACARLLEGWRAAAGAAALALALAAGTAAAFRGGLWLDAAAPELALWLSFAGGSAYGYAVEGRQKRYLRRAFSHYLSEDVVEQLVADPKKLALGGERREVTTYFSDIEGFTTISESLSPERLTYMMSRFLGLMTDTILESEGTLDKYIGDAVMAFWNAPAPAADHALRGCRAALDNQRKLAALREELLREGFPPLRTRIGLNTGPASIGNMGSARRFSYTAIGDSVNLASRLEGANKAYGTYVMISEATRLAAGDAIETRELDFLQVKGKNVPVRVYELLGLKGRTDEALLRRARVFEKGLALYRERRWDEAAAAFEESSRVCGPDAASRRYLERVERLRREPPPKDWDGSYALTEK